MSRFFINKTERNTCSVVIVWCPRPDLNRHEVWISQDFKSCASTYSATRANKMVSCAELESTTLWLKVKCSTDWASGTKMAALDGLEPSECQSQSLVPYHLATRQYYKWWREMDSNHRTRRNRFTVCRV